MNDSTQSPIVPPNWRLPEAIFERLGCGAGPQRAMREDGHLLIILHQIPELNERTRKPALFWRHPNGHWENSFDATGVKALWKLMLDYEARIESLDDVENNAQSALEFHTVLEALTPILDKLAPLNR